MMIVVLKDGLMSVKKNQRKKSENLKNLNIYQYKCSSANFPNKHQFFRIECPVYKKAK